MLFDGSFFCCGLCFCFVSFVCCLMAVVRCVLCVASCLRFADCCSFLFGLACVVSGFDV